MVLINDPAVASLQVLTEEWASPLPHLSDCPAVQLSPFWVCPWDGECSPISKCSFLRLLMDIFYPPLLKNLGQFPRGGIAVSLSVHVPRGWLQTGLQGWAVPVLMNYFPTQNLGAIFVSLILKS